MANWAKVTNGSSAAFWPNQARKRKEPINNQNNFLVKNCQLELRISDLILKGKIAQINMALTMTITPPNLLGMALSIA